MSIVLGFSKEFIGSVMRALKYKMFYITLIFIAEKIRAMLFIFLYILHKTDEFCLTGGENVIIASY